MTINKIITGGGSKKESAAINLFTSDEKKSSAEKSGSGAKDSTGDKINGGGVVPDIDSNAVEEGIITKTGDLN
jgi:hypothetical protein